MDMDKLKKGFNDTTESAKDQINKSTYNSKDIF